MARIRTIKPEFWTDESIVECSRDARLLFIGIWNHCDDAGIIEASIKQMKMKIFPGDFDIMPEDIQRMLDELSANNLIELYEVEKRNYIKVLGWDKHQKIDKPSYKHPLPSGVVPTTRQQYIEERSASVRRAPPPGMEGNGREWKGMEGNGEEKDSCPEPSQAKPSGQPVIELPSNRKNETYPVTTDQVVEFASLYPAVDVDQELRNMRGWLMTNPAKRKTKAGMPRFIANWLAREQNRGGKVAAAIPRLSPADQAIENRRARVNA